MTQETSPLNEGQQKAAEQIFAFLVGPDKEMNLSGPGGSGKTHLMGHIIDKVIPEVQKIAELVQSPVQLHNVQMCATTNKAAEVLGKSVKRPTDTVHSAFGLTVKTDFQTGKTSTVRSKKWAMKHNTVFFIDEAYGMDSQLRNIILDSTQNCKIINVGDHCQLGPIFENISPIHTAGLPTAYLTEQMRNRNQPALKAICDQLRRTVETGVFEPIKRVPGVIDFMDENEFSNEICHLLGSPTEDNLHKIIAYDNNRVLQYTEHLRFVRGLGDQIEVGEKLVNNTMYQDDGKMMSVEEEVEVLSIRDRIDTESVTHDATFTTRRADLKTQWGGVIADVPIPTDVAHFQALKAWYKRNKNWYAFYAMQERFPDLRMREASTVHKAQGSTHDTILIDLGNLSACPNPLVAARLLYVAFSRARNRVICFGDLAQKYGGLIG